MDIRKWECDIQSVPDPLSADLVRRHLDTIAVSSGFANSGRLTRFLRFAVEAKLCGEESRLKELTIGRDVFDRGNDFDPRLDPIVRVEARRLRRRLEEFYRDAGRPEPIRIDFPKGGYVPSISETSDPEAPAVPVSPVWRIKWVPAVAAVLLVCAVLLLSRFGASGRSSDVAVVPARWVWKMTEGLDPRDEEVAEELTAALAQHSRIGVTAWPVTANERGEKRDLRQIGQLLGARNLAIVSVRREEPGLRVTVFLLDPVSGRKVWVGDEDAVAGSREAVRAACARAAERVADVVTGRSKR